MNSHRRYTRLFFLLLLFGSISPTLAQDSLNVSLLSRFDFSRSGAIAVHGDYAYVAEYNLGLRIFDVSNRNQPRLIRSLYQDAILNDIQTANGYLYIASFDGIRIYDLNTQPDLQEIGFCPLENGSNVLAVHDNYIYVASSHFGLRIIEAFNPRQPFVIGSCPLPGNTGNVAVFGDYAYVTSTEGLIIIRINDPANPTLVGTDWQYRRTARISVQGGYALLATSELGVHILSLLNPNAPQSIGILNDTRNYWCSGIAGNLAILTGSHSPIRIYNLSNPSQPVLLAAFDSTSQGGDLAILGNYVYLTDYGYGMRILDITNPAQPITLSTYRVTGSISDFKVSGRRIYFAVSQGGLNIVDFSDLHSLQSIGSFDTPGTTSSIAVQQNFAYLADYTNGLRIVDIQNPANLVERSVFNFELQPDQVCVQGDYAYVRDSYGMLQIINIANPNNPFETGRFDSIRTYINQMTLQGRYLFLASDSEGLFILDIDDCHHPQCVSHFPIRFGARSVAVSGNRAYVSNSRVMLILDITNRSSPVQIGRYDSQLTHNQLSADGDYVLVSDAQHDLVVLNVSNPNEINRVGYFTTSYYPITNLIFFMSGDTIFAGRDQSFRIFAVSQALGVVDRIGTEIPNDFRIERIYPNPFNATATLTYTLPNTANVKLELYDITGRSVGKLFDWTQDAGTYSVKINSDNLSSGTYFAFLTAGKQSLSQKFVVLK